MVRPLLLSLLVRQALALKERFRSRYPNAWLVWEAGAWHVPEPDEQGVAVTRLSTPDLLDCLPSGEDALCFELHPGIPPRALRLGRAASNDLVVNDATVSREHLTLLPGEGDAWLVEPLPGSSVLLSGRALPVGAPTRLLANAELRLGEIRMTFHDLHSFIARVEALAAQASGDAR